MYLFIPEKAGCLSFAYNMFGRNVNKLSLFLEDSASNKTELWSKTGNQGSDWLRADISVPATNGLNVSMMPVASLYPLIFFFLLEPRQHWPIVE